MNWDIIIKVSAQCIVIDVANSKITRLRLRYIRVYFYIIITIISYNPSWNCFFSLEMIVNEFDRESVLLAAHRSKRELNRYILLRRIRLYWKFI